MTAERTDAQKLETPKKITETITVLINSSHPAFHGLKQFLYNHTASIQITFFNFIELKLTNSIVSQTVYWCLRLLKSNGPSNKTPALQIIYS